MANQKPDSTPGPTNIQAAMNNVHCAEWHLQQARRKRQSDGYRAEDIAFEIRCASFHRKRAKAFFHAADVVGER